MINIVIPMAGAGKRFELQQYKKPKPLIDIFGKTMIEAVVENLNIDGRFIFIIRKQHDDEYNLHDALKNIKQDCIVIETENLTNGPVSSVLLAKKYINNNDSLIIANCDQIIDDFNFNFLMNFVSVKCADGVLGSFISTSSKNSYMILDEYGRVIRVIEKIVVSNTATNGFHFWKCGRMFVDSVNEMIENNDRCGDEFYIAPSFNYMIKKGLSVFPYFYNLHYPVGTPEDLIKYMDCHGNNKI